MKNTKTSFILAIACGLAGSVGCSSDDNNAPGSTGSATASSGDAGGTGTTGATTGGATSGTTDSGGTSNTTGASTGATTGATTGASTTGTTGATSGGTGLDAGNAQTPPMGRANIEAWLAAGAYKNWHCESSVHPARDPSPHGYNRICSNDLIASRASWPRGAAAVKEIFAALPEAGAALTPTGYAVYLKSNADSAGGNNWYWYERIGSGVVADGLARPSRTVGIQPMPFAWVATSLPARRTT